MQESKKNIGAAIIGMGNILLTDDGVGVHAVRKLREDAPEGIILAEVGAAVLDALDIFESVELVVAIDAVLGGGAPGSIYSFDVSEVDAGRNVSVHELGIAAALRYLPAGSRPRITIVGVEPDVIDYGMELTPVVGAALDEVVRTARAVALESTEKVPPTTGV